MAKPYLIMLPGWGVKSFAFDKLSELLSKDFELIFIEWENISSVNDFKERVIKVIEERHISTFSMLGWSLGSLVAQDIAADNLWDIKHLILIGGTSSFVQHKEEGYEIGWNKRIVERMKSALYKKPEEVLYNFYALMFSKDEKLKGLDKEFLQLVEDNIEEPAINSLAIGLDYLIQKDLRNKLLDITIPLLTIHGEEDSICPLEAATYINNRILNSNIEVISYAGHIPFFTSHGQCYTAISKFVAKNI